MNKYKTEQEVFWAGEFGDKYIERNNSAKIIAANLSLFSKVLANTKNINSVIEFGANIGLNLSAIRNLLPHAALSAIEINSKAVKELQNIKGIKIEHKSILEFSPENEYDFVLIKGVLIHINPKALGQAYDLLYKTSKRYICVVEYYNPAPVEIAYRGQKDKLFKRDFAGEIMDRFNDLKLINYGFLYHRDNAFPMDDLTWFLLEK